MSTNSRSQKGSPAAAARPARGAKPRSPSGRRSRPADPSAAAKARASAHRKAPLRSPAKPRETQQSTDGTKQAKLIEALRAERGASITDLMALTGWQAHTVRGSISGVLRKKLGLTVTCEDSSEAGGRVYRIVAAAAP